MNIVSSMQMCSEAVDLSPSSVLRIQNLELALEKAVQDISLLQGNLAYVISLKEELETELAVRQRREEARFREMEKQLALKDREIDSLRRSQQELGDLLAETKQTLEHQQAACEQREDETHRLERRLEEQRTTILSLEEELAAFRYSSEVSYSNLTQDNIKVYELECQLEEARYQLQKGKGAVEREQQKYQSLLKRYQQFKGWLGSIAGIRKVVDGCEDIVMAQVAEKLHLK